MKANNEKECKEQLLDEYQSICDEINELDEQIADYCSQLVELQNQSPKYSAILEDLGDVLLINADYRDCK